MSDVRCDVLVIGAGPAGSATAIFLARCGYDVVLLDRAQFPRDKPCGEYLTPGAVSLLRDGLGVLTALEAQGAAWLSREHVIPHDGPGFGGATRALACPRTVTDSVLRDAAVAAGATVAEGFSARRILFDGGQVTGVTGTDSGGAAQTYRARVTVGADGTRSLLARTLGVVRPIPRLQRVALVTHYRQADFPAVRPTSPFQNGSLERAEAGVTMHLPSDHSDACCGVGAACGPNRTFNVNIVVPASEAGQMARRRQEYFEECLRRSFPHVWAQVQFAEQVGPLRSVGCFGHSTTRASHAGAVLVGDAATFIHPFTGEGVYFALKGAQLAAHTIDAALRHGDIGGAHLRAYDAARRRELLPRYRLCDAVQRIVHSPALLAWGAARLRRSSDLTEALLRTVGDLARPADLFSLPNLRLALSTL